MAYDVLSDRLGEVLTRRLPAALDDHARSGRGSAWNGIAWHGYVNKDLRSILGRNVRAPYELSYCGKGNRSDCWATLRASLASAVQRVLTAQDERRVRDLTYETSIDDIRDVTAGTVGTRPTDWQNRPTFQQEVAFHRPSPAVALVLYGTICPRPNV